MRVLAVSVGRSRQVRWNGDVVSTSIFKTPVEGRVWVDATNIAGDEQADPTVHGGHWKAVYAYPFEHYATWQRDLGIASLPFASFGENLTTEGLLESHVGVGDRLRIGSAVFMVTQPRLPCYKLGIRFDRVNMVARFASVDRSGFYLSVEEEGEIGAADAVEVLERDTRGLTVAELYRLRLGGGPPDRLATAASHPALPDGLRDHFRRAARGGPA